MMVNSKRLHYNSEHVLLFTLFNENLNNLRVFIWLSFPQLLLKEFTVTNLEHLNQQGVGLPVAEVVHNLMRDDREFEVIGANIPGVHYDFELK